MVTLKARIVTNNALVNNCLRQAPNYCKRLFFLLLLQYKREAPVQTPNPLTQGAMAKEPPEGAQLPRERRATPDVSVRNTECKQARNAVK